MKEESQEELEAYSEGSNQSFDQENNNETKKTSSFETVGSLINQMMGGTMLVLPVLFTKNGIFGAAINMAIAGVISCKTCMIYLEHFKPNEQEYNESIIRILGQKYETTFRIAKCAYLFLTAVIYFILMTLQMYTVVIFIIQLFTDQCSDGALTCPYFVQVEDTKQLQFNKFSVPYMTIGTFIFAIIISFKKEMIVFIKIASFGFLAIVLFMVFIFYIFINNVFIQPDFKTAWNDPDQHIRTFSWDIGELAGTSALAFAIHVNSATTIKANANQDKNKRDLALVYIIGGIMYISIGFFGSLGTYGSCTQGAKAVSVTDCFGSSDPANLFVTCVYLFNLVTSFPIYLGVMKGSFFNLILQGEVPSAKADAIFNFSFLIFCAILQNTGLPVDTLMSLNGAVCCFFFVYLIPILMHMKCYHGENKLMNQIKRSMSVIGLMKADTGKDQQKLKLENQKYRERFISQANTERTQSLMPGNQAALRKPSVDNPYYAQYTQQRKFSQVQRTMSTTIGIQQKRETFDDAGQKIENHQKYNIANNNNNLQTPMLGGDNRVIQSYTTDNTNDHGDEEDVTDRLSFQSCNDHSDKEGKSQTLRVIIYGIAGIIGLSILLFEIFIITKALVCPSCGSEKNT